MREAHNLDGWDATVAAFLSSRQAIGRDYRNERWILRNLRSFLEGVGATDLDATLFDRWRAQFQHLGSSSRFAREHTVNKLCRYRRPNDPDCFLPDQEPLSWRKRHPLATTGQPPPGRPPPRRPPPHPGQPAKPGYPRRRPAPTARRPHRRDDHNRRSAAPAHRSGR